MGKSWASCSGRPTVRWLVRVTADDLTLAGRTVRGIRGRRSANEQPGEATMARRSSQPRRHKMRQQARRESARAWVASGAPISVKAFARRYGLDRYTAREDLIAIDFPLAPGDNRWAVRPAPTPKRPLAEPADLDEDWIWIGDRRMFVVGHTPGGTPYGWVDDSFDGAEDWLP
jgi:hypothetical protein